MFQHVSVIVHQQALVIINHKLIFVQITALKYAGRRYSKWSARSWGISLLRISSTVPYHLQCPNMIGYIIVVPVMAVRWLAISSWHLTTMASLGNITIARTLYYAEPPVNVNISKASSSNIQHATLVIIGPADDFACDDARRQSAIILTAYWNILRWLTILIVNTFL